MLNKDELIINNTERKLLLGIYETLQEIKEMIATRTNVPVSVTREQITDEEKSIVYTCKVCGQTYDNKGSLMACGRKHKKEGA